MVLTKHENESFVNQTVYIGGQAFVNCTFIGCTLVLRETFHLLERCSFVRCNWHVDWVLMWGSPESLREIKALVSMIEQAQMQQNIQAEGTPGAAASAPVQLPQDLIAPLTIAPPVAAPTGENLTLSQPDSQEAQTTQS
jgi:hypothetical protein